MKSGQLWCISDDEVTAGKVYMLLRELSFIDGDKGWEVYYEGRVQEWCGSETWSQRDTLLSDPSVTAP